MRYRTTRIARLIALGAVLTLAAAACGGGGGGSSSADLSGASITVGSKEFTEELILGQIAIQVLENAGADVDDQTGIVGTANTRTALTSGKIDMYWEYTGTGWTTNLGNEISAAPPDPRALFRKVAQQDLKQNHIKWLAMAPMNDTYAIATSEKVAQQTGVKTLSDYAKLANTNPSEASLCAATEFLTRDDGWPGVEKAYNFHLPSSEVSEVDLGIIYTQVPKATRCKFGEVFATDGRIPANHMVVLDDDKDFFVKYNVALNVRESVYKQYPQIAKLFDPIAKKLTTETMQNLNAKVDVQGMTPDIVAKQWLENNGFIG